MKTYQTITLAILSLFLFSCNQKPKEMQSPEIVFEKDNQNNLWFRNNAFQLKIDRHFHFKFYDTNNKSINVADEKSGSPFFIMVNEKKITGYDLDATNIKEATVNTVFGEGKRFVLTGKYKSKAIEQQITLEFYPEYPDAVISHVRYTNTGNDNIIIDEIYNNVFTLDARMTNEDNQPYGFWTFQGVAHDWGLDYIFSLPGDFERENYLGLQEESLMGGGVPLNDYWNETMGMAIAHIEPKPTIASMPVKVNKNQTVEIGIKKKMDKELGPGESIESILTATTIHHMDYYDAVKTYGRLMAAQGLRMEPFAKEAYEAIWCGWGYESDFTPEDIINTLPKIKEMGIRWVVIDDRWFDRYGDWNTREETFPGGMRQLKQFVQDLHDQGFLTKIWWAPTPAQPEVITNERRWPSATPGASDVAKQHPEWLVMDEQGNYQRCFRNMYFLDPASPEVQQYMEDLTRMFIDDLGFDGHKLDAYYIVPPNYNPEGQGEYPEQSYEDVPELIRIIHETSKELKPYSVTEICNCGVPQDFYQSIHTDQPVVSDPTSYEQVRNRVKLNKALWGPDCPIYGDHVEHVKVNDDKLGMDFASSVGTGAVIGTKFTWPAGPEKVRLTPEKEPHYKKWIALYNEKMLSKGEYLNLYDIAYDKPETHVIRKDGKMYYSFYADEWNGDIELRGLEDKDYTVRDYVNDVDIEMVSNGNNKINVTFTDHLFIECTPVNN